MLRQWRWNDWKCPRGEIFLTDDEKSFAEPYAGLVIVEPNLKPKASPNKDWGLGRWQALVDARRDIPWAQIGPIGTHALRGVQMIHTPDFRHGCAVLARARTAVLPEGGLHHAAAALSVPAVVIFGGFISPKQTGYAGQHNLFTGGQPCGMREPCEHCRKAMAAITVENVLQELETIL